MEQAGRLELSLSAWLPVLWDGVGHSWHEVLLLGVAGGVLRPLPHTRYAGSLLLNFQAWQLIFLSWLLLCLLGHVLCVQGLTSLNQIIETRAEVDQVLRYVLLLVPQFILFEIQILSFRQVLVLDVQENVY